MSISSYLDRKKEELKKPSILPQGHYRLKIDRPFEERPSSNGNWTMLNFPCKVMAAQHDVDPDEIAELTRPVEQFYVRKTFIFNNENEEANEETLWNVQQFLNKLGLEAEGNVSLRQQMDSCVGYEFVAPITHRISRQNPEDVFAEVGRDTLSLDDIEELA